MATKLKQDLAFLNDFCKQNPEVKQEEREKEEKRLMDKWAKQIMDEIMDALNCMSNGDQVALALAEAFHRQHRTLQQSFFCGFICNLVLQMNKLKKEKNFDPRNEFSMRLAEQFAQHLKDLTFDDKPFQGPHI